MGASTKSGDGNVIKMFHMQTQLYSHTSHLILNPTIVIVTSKVYTATRLYF